MLYTIDKHSCAKNEKKLKALKANLHLLSFEQVPRDP